MNINSLIKSYMDQTVQAFKQADPHYANYVYPRSYIPEMKEKGLGDNVAGENEMSVLYETGGLFANCDTEAPVMNTLIQPQFTMANLIPVTPTNNDKVKYSFLTDVTEADDTYPDAPCDASPVVGDINGAAWVEFYPGRISYRTKTGELDYLIRRAHSGIREDLYFIGSIRGVSAIPTANQLRDPDLVKRGAVRRSMMFLMRAMQRDLSNLFWSGDPTNVSTNTTNGGRKEFWGLNALIADDYGTKTFVTGTNKTKLNSFLLDFEDNTIGGGTSILSYMQEAEDQIFQRASYMGLLPYKMVIAMHPIVWSEVVKYLPCEMLTDTCVSPTAPIQSDAGVMVTVNGDNGLGMQALRQQLAQGRQLTLNGRVYDVVLDHYIPISKDATDPEYTSSIYFIPLTVAGETVLEWTHRDYRSFETELTLIPGAVDAGLRGWTDGGRYHLIVERAMRCFEVDTKIEPGLVFRAPHLAARIDNVIARPMTAKPYPYPGVTAEA
jgi:hypothetical protein